MYSRYIYTGTCPVVSMAEVAASVLLSHPVDGEVCSVMNGPSWQIASLNKIKGKSRKIFYPKFFHETTQATYKPLSILCKFCEVICKNQKPKVS